MTRPDLVPPETLEGLTERQIADVKTDFDVVTELKLLGHDVRVVGVEDALPPLADAIDAHSPHVVFNLLEEYAGSLVKLAHVLGWLELIGQPYTGCGPTGMLFGTSKALQRKILRHHRIRTPEFTIFRVGKAVRRPRRLEFPLIVKSLTAHGSAGISQASIVTNDERLADRVAFVHDQIGTDAIAEQYIDGRELYVGLLGNKRIDALPVWELVFESLPEGAPRIATERVKWDPRYQQIAGVDATRAQGLSPELERRIVRRCKRAYRALEQTGYARIDLRLDADGTIWMIESNPNPQLSLDEELALAAKHAGVPYDRLISRILSLGMRRPMGEE